SVIDPRRRPPVPITGKYHRRLTTQLRNGCRAVCHSAIPAEAVRPLRPNRLVNAFFSHPKGGSTSRSPPGTQRMVEIPAAECIISASPGWPSDSGVEGKAHQSSLSPWVLQPISLLINLKQPKTRTLAELNAPIQGV